MSNGKIIKSVNVRHKKIKPRIIELLESRPNERLSNIDVARFLNENENEMKELCDSLYYENLIQREEKLNNGIVIFQFKQRS